jgi:hypothetical protein
MKMAIYEDYEQPTQRAPRPAAGPSETVVLRTGPASFAWLVAINAPLAGHLFRLDPKGTVLGRDARSDIILDDDAVSDLHAKLRAEGEEDDQPKFYIYDLASTNGTLVNGEAITKCPLNDGDRIVIGQTTLVFKQV